MSITRRSILGIAAAWPALLLPRRSQAQDNIPEIAKGPFNGAESLKQYRIPEWFRDYKFGMWAHWGPQSAAEYGDWYARNMYMQDSPQYKYHVETYGHPSRVGFKDVCLTWHGKEFDAEHLILYKKAGAKYFMSMGVHHDNFDLWNSTHQPRWNAVATGPKKDVVGLFAAAARKNGLKFAVSEHLSNSYNWLAVSHGADKTGPQAGVPYDGTDPAYADLYHPFPKDKPIPAQAMSRDVPDSYKRLYFLRIQDLVDKYKPDLLYTDRHSVRRVGLQAGLPLLQPSAERHLHQQSKEGLRAGDLRSRHRTRRGRRHTARAVADRHLHRRLALQEGTKI